MKKSDLKVLGILAIIFISLVFIYTGFNNVFGSRIDWVMQHTVIPDYLRTLFYSTGDLTPNLALNIGAGENAYYLSYYGLLNPFILLSYLFPFIKMIDYLIVINIIIVITSAFLIYKWLCNNKFNPQIAFVSSLLFMLINVFFHAHKHIMFIDYIPFLILGLMGIDKYFKDKKSYLYIISVFLMIMTNYYYSVAGLLCLLIYGIYKYILINKKITFKSFMMDGIKFLMPMLIGIFMSLILLVPTAYAIISSRSQVKELVSLKALLIPNFNFNTLLYDNYGMGFTFISVIALIYILIHSKGAKRFLSTTLFIVFIIPIFMYVLNGMLYLRTKAFIPLCPLIVLLIAIFLNDLKDKKIPLINVIIIVLFTLIMSLLFRYHELYFFIDLILTSLGIIIFILKPNKGLYIGLILIALISNISINRNDKYVSKDIYNNLTSQSVNNLISTINEKDKSFYRMDNIKGDTSLIVNKIYNDRYYQTSLYSSTYNSYYKNFYDNVINNAIPYRNNLLRASTSNIMFDTLMNIKYIVTSDDNVPIGYTKVLGNNDEGIYQNNNTLTLGYSSSSLMSKNDFNKLNYPYRNEALLKYIVIDKKITSDYITSIEETDLSYQMTNSIDIEKTDVGYTVDTNKEETLNLKLDKPINNEILLVKFTLDKAPNCSKGDISITINNITNKLTCKQWLYFNNNYDFEYAISSPNPINELNIIFSKGHFEISNIKTYTLNYNTILDNVSKVDKLIVDSDKTKGDIIEGSIDATNDGYFATTIPYDKGFTIYVDGKKVNYEMVNESFIGFSITKGTHHIKMIYQSPCYKVGLIGSIFGVLLFICVIILENKKDIYGKLQKK
jgi:uncharacterized membrane protein YfhO